MERLELIAVVGLFVLGSIGWLLGRSIAELQDNTNKNLSRIQDELKMIREELVRQRRY